MELAGPRIRTSIIIERKHLTYVAGIPSERDYVYHFIDLWYLLPAPNEGSESPF